MTETKSTQKDVTRSVVIVIKKHVILIAYSFNEYYVFVYILTYILCLNYKLFVEKNEAFFTPMTIIPPGTNFVYFCAKLIYIPDPLALMKININRITE